jgi:hypothetical protein
MNDPATALAETTGDLSPFGRAGGILGSRRADAGVILRRTDGSACLVAREQPESTDDGSKGTAIWGIPGKTSGPACRARNAVAASAVFMRARFVARVPLPGYAGFQ